MATAQPAIPENFDIGRVLTLTFAVIGRNAPLFFGVAFVVGAIPQILFQYYLFGITPAGSGPNVAAAFAMANATGSFLLFYIVLIVLSALLSAVLTCATIEDLNGGRPSFGECLSTALSLLLPAVAIGVLTAIGVAIGFVLLIVPGIILWLGWVIAVPVLVQERAGVLGSMARSRNLTSGSRWRLFGMFVVIVIALWVLQIALGLVSAIGIGIGLPFVMIAISTAITATLSTVAMTTATAASYVELRRVKEGTSIDELAQIFA